MKVECYAMCVSSVLLATSNSVAWQDGIKNETRNIGCNEDEPDVIVPTHFESLWLSIVSVQMFDECGGVVDPRGVPRAKLTRK